MKNLNTKISLIFIFVISALVLKFIKNSKTKYNKSNMNTNVKIVFFIPFDYNYLHYDSYLSDNNLSSENFSYEDYINNTDYYLGEMKTYFSYGKSIDFLKWEIFSSINGYVRLKKYFINTEEIEAYFKNKYNKCFFYSKIRCDGRFPNQIFKKEGVNFEDFKKIILPNFKMNFIQEISTNPPKNQNVIFNWDFFLDINNFSTPNTLYMRYTEVYSSEIICNVLENLFVSSVYRADAILNGLTFNNKPKLNATITKYFYIESFEKYTLKIRKNWQCHELKDNKKDFFHILSYFESINRPICKIYKDNKLISISSFEDK